MMKWNTIFRYSLAVCYVVLLFVDIEYNAYFYYLLTLIFIVISLKNFLRILSYEKRSVARFHATYKFTLETKNAIRIGLALLLLFGAMYFFEKIPFQLEMLDSVKMVYFLPFLIPGTTSLIIDFRFYQYFLSDEGVFQVSDQHIFPWDTIESYTLHFTDYEVSLDLKFKDNERLKFESRKKKDVAIKELITMFEKKQIMKT